METLTHDDALKIKEIIKKNHFQIDIKILIDDILELEPFKDYLNGKKTMLPVYFSLSEGPEIYFMPEPNPCIVRYIDENDAIHEYDLTDQLIRINLKDFEKYVC